MTNRFELTTENAKTDDHASRNSDHAVDFRQQLHTLTAAELLEIGKKMDAAAQGGSKLPIVELTGAGGKGGSMPHSDRLPEAKPDRTGVPMPDMSIPKWFMLL